MPSHVPVSVRRSVLAPLDRAARARAVEQRLIEAIELGLFADGEQLPAEPVLAARFGVSTVTLREALVELRRRGLVETRRGRGGGSFVRAPKTDDAALARDRLSACSADELRDIADERAAIAAAAARLAAERASPADIERLARHVDDFSSAESDAARRRYDVRTHVELPAIARARRLTAAEMDLQAEISAYLWLTFSGADASAACAEHRAIVDAVRSGNAEEAARRAGDHVAREMRELIRIRLALIPPADHDGSASQAIEVVATAVDEVFGTVARVHETVLRIRGAARKAGRRLKRAHIEPLRTLLDAELARLPIVAGAGMIFAPGALADDVRYLEWLCRSESGPPERLLTTLDPEAPDFYDYEAAEWYYEPRDHGARWIAGPFIDHSGTNAHIFTLTEPVTDETGEFLGVAGADLTVAAVEQIAAPPLAAVPRDAVMLSRRDRVIASNSAAWLPGTLYRVRKADVVVRDERLPWAVVLVASR